MNFIKVEQCAYTDGAGNVQTTQAYLNLDNVIAVYPDANLVMTNASLNAPRELACMTLTDESFGEVLKAIASPEAAEADRFCPECGIQLCARKHSTYDEMVYNITKWLKERQVNGTLEKEGK